MIEKYHNDVKLAIKEMNQKQAEKKDTTDSRKGTLIYVALGFLGLITVLLITFSWLV